ncbi:5731_t:CDS:2 [Acaulospora morrowiae]|uniref:5731_t:CDS:1 n=1 Tax=Acaulospora morrowiae TaxID=94023 RepID=A0A9N9GYV8_9GLOM|nr:5731_t:CDS:2 [Acaulospora morrowiae]
MSGFSLRLCNSGCCMSAGLQSQCLHESSQCCMKAGLQSQCCTKVDVQLFADIPCCTEIDVQIQQPLFADIPCCTKMDVQIQQPLLADIPCGVYDINDLNFPVLIGHLTDISLMDSIGILILDSYQVKVAASSPTKRHVCILCEKSFLSSSALRVHENSHTREKLYKCEDEGCGKIYTTNSNLLRHKKKHN